MTKEIMDDFDEGYEKGFRDGHEGGMHDGHEGGVEDGYELGKSYAQDKVLELMEEVIHEYKLLAQAGKMDSESTRIPKAQLNAVEFMKRWVCSGGHTDEDGNRACLVW
jgi:flagellar biosynthesis/type III secretory pathway protein FliH